MKLTNSDFNKIESILLDFNKNKVFDENFIDSMYISLLNCLNNRLDLDCEQENFVRTILN